MSAGWAGGIFVGYNRKSNSYRSMTDDGKVDGPRALQGKPTLQRWDVDKLANVKVAPWSMRITEVAVRVDMGAEVEGHHVPVPEAVPEARRVRITMEVLQGFGSTESCKQCDHIRASKEDKAGIAHSEACRNRITVAMAATARGAARLGDKEPSTTTPLLIAYGSPMPGAMMLVHNLSWRHRPGRGARGRRTPQGTAP